MSPITEKRRVQFEIPEGASVQIIVGSPAPSASRSTLPALLDAAPAEHSAPRAGRPLLKGGLIVMLLAASFAVGDYFASRSSAPPPTGSGPGQAFAGAGSLAGATAALPRPAPAGEQHAFPNRPLPHAAAAPAPGGQIPAEFQKQLQQPPTVTPPPGQATAPPAPGSGSPAFTGPGSPGKNPFGLEN